MLRMTHLTSPLPRVGALHAFLDRHLVLELTAMMALAGAGFVLAVTLAAWAVSLPLGLMLGI